MIPLKFAVLFTVAAIGCTMAEAAPRWRSGFGMGVTELSIDHGPGNAFTINCAESAMRGASIAISIAGKRPEPNSEIRIYVDNEEFQFFTDGMRWIETDSRAASDNFTALWRALRKGRSLRVTFARDMASSTFSTVGAAQVLRADIPCKTGFQM